MKRTDRTWCVAPGGGRVPAAGVLWYRLRQTSDSEPPRLELAMLLIAERKGDTARLDAFGGKCEPEDWGIAGTLTREWGQETYNTSWLPHSTFDTAIKKARIVLPGRGSPPSRKRTRGELVFLEHSEPGAHSFACLIAPFPARKALPDPAEYAAARQAAMNSVVPPIDYVGELGVRWVDYAELPGLPLAKRLDLVLSRARLLDELAPPGVPRYTSMRPPQGTTIPGVGSRVSTASAMSVVQAALVAIVRLAVGDTLEPARSARPPSASCPVLRAVPPVPTETSKKRRRRGRRPKV